MDYRMWMVVVSCSVGCGPAVDAGGDSETSGTDESTTESSTETGTPQPTTVGVETSEATTDPAPSALTGEYLLALSVIIAPQTPLQFHTTVVHDTVAGTVSMQLQPLSLDAGATTMPRLPVGDPLDFVAAIDADGRFRLDLGELFIVGAANPITGSDIVAAVVVDGTAMGRELWCGAAFGQVTEPLDLDLTGSTFAFTPIDGGSLPGDPLVIACPP